MNLSEFDSGVRGSIQGLQFGQDARVDELNERIQSRHFPDQPLQPNFDPRSTPTKYARFPLIERRAAPSVPIQTGVPFDPTRNFSAAINRGPVGAYLANIDTDTVLRGYTNALQRGADQNVYVPHSSSELYQTPIAVGRQETQTHPLLSEFPQSYHTRVPEVVSKLGRDVFSNHTRVQLRDM